MMIAAVACNQKETVISTDSAAPAPQAESAIAKSDAGVWVMRSDGSKSCEPNTAKGLEQDAKELEGKGIRILESRKGDDGMMHAQGCGMNTGSTNMFKIPADQIALATSIGFAEHKHD